MQIVPLTSDEAAQQGYNTKIVLTHEDFVNGVPSAWVSGTWKSLITLPIGTVVKDVACYVKTGFLGSDALSAVAIDVGDVALPAEYIAAQAAYGASPTRVAININTSDNIYTAASGLGVEITVTGGTIANFTAGEIHVLAMIVPLASLVS